MQAPWAQTILKPNAYLINFFHNFWPLQKWEEKHTSLDHYHGWESACKYKCTSLVSLFSSLPIIQPLYTVSLASVPGRPTIENWRPGNETIASYQMLMVRRTGNEASVHIELVESGTCNAEQNYVIQSTKLFEYKALICRWKTWTLPKNSANEHCSTLVQPSSHCKYDQ